MVPPHAHHAIQIVISLDDPIAVAGRDGQWRQAHGIIVQPDAVHSFDCSGAFGAMLFVDPEASEGAWLRAVLTEDITTLSEARLAAPVSELRSFTDVPMPPAANGAANASERITRRNAPTHPAVRPATRASSGEQPCPPPEACALIRHCAQALSSGPPPRRRLDPRVTKVLHHIQVSDDLRISLEAAAALAFLSPSRFAHLFRQQVGLPFSRYMLWRKLTRAMLAIGSQRTIADAAQAADFADAAHLTRTFNQMVGMAPSVLMRGTFTEIPSPFNTTPQ
ncbi:helix-turn-helix domain-containing protein [Paludibaculum fermentans]|uniref:Helix-turn-helix domain-containing protein n=1 Tax=Paludibaculum fermentans TaxID=1473598 RepID=A0A7S7NVF5_PALFE|nr:helix-turn-helix domain-containing protein [Paludibaculum fermentans]QOY90526.1 helix-turn-helix domain-containing protein [Paludibaculum fermentans]